MYPPPLPYPPGVPLPLLLPQPPAFGAFDGIAEIGDGVTVGWGGGELDGGGLPEIYCCVCHVCGCHC